MELNVRGGLTVKSTFTGIPQDHGLFPMTTWARHVATPDLWPEELIDDIAGWFDDLRVGGLRWSGGFNGSMDHRPLQG